MASRALRQSLGAGAAAKRVDRSATERATRYVEKASRVRLQDVTDNPGARVKVRKRRACSLSAHQALFAFRDTLLTRSFTTKRVTRSANCSGPQSRRSAGSGATGEAADAAVLRRRPRATLRYQPWQRLFPGERAFNGDINLRREYVPLSLLELQRLVDLGWLDTRRLVDLTQLCNTQLVNVRAAWRQFGIHLTDEVRWRRRRRRRR